MNPSIDRLIHDVVARDACSGCGACTLIDSGLSMKLSPEGYARPVREGGAPPEAAAEHFKRVCPGLVVAAPRRDGRRVHPTMGPFVSAWEVWSTDPEIRFFGSSGGALTALSTWLLETGQARRVTGVSAEAKDPRRSVPVTITTRDEAIASAGSRYAPVGAAGNPACTAPGTAAIGKPCEIAALSALTTAKGIGEPLRLSFFCAGTPSSHATDRLSHDLGAPTGAVPEALRYRGHGWPGNFTVQVNGTEYSTTYDVAWGENLGRATQWRCKVCVDGVGDSADVVAADFWRTDARGYPIFHEGTGVSALIARTERGAEVVGRAIAAGILEASPLDLDELAAVQPLQVARRTYLFARLLGSRFAGRRPPAYPGYGWRLVCLSMRHPRKAARVVRETWSRVRKARASR